MVVLTAKVAERMEKIVKPCLFGDADPVMVVSFLRKTKSLVTPMEY